MLSAPIIVPLVSVLNTTTGVRVRGQLIDSTVRIFVDGEPDSIGQDIATKADTVIPVTKPLRIGQLLRATQEKDGEVSSVSADPVTVIPAPTIEDLGPITPVTHLFECGTGIWFTEAFPGADVTLKVAADVSITAHAVDGEVVFDLPRGLTRTDVVTVQQTTAGVAGQTHTLPNVDPKHAFGWIGSHAWKLPAPDISEPVYKCQRYMPISSIVDGATVNVRRGTGRVEKACFPMPSGSFSLTKPLESEEVIEVWQSFPSCEIQGEIVRVKVKSERPVPTLEDSICAGDQYVTVAGLFKEAEVQVFGDGAVIGHVAAWAGQCDVPVTSLSGFAAVTARQALCQSEWSDFSPAVAIDHKGEGDLDPVISVPLMECGRAIHASGLQRGVRVRAISKRYGEISELTRVDEEEADIALKRPLVESDFVFVKATRCGKVIQSQPAEVRKAVIPNTISAIAPIDDPGGRVRFAPTLPGATVELYVRRVGSDSLLFAGATVATSGLTDVSSRLHLRPGDLLAARQGICSSTSGLGQFQKFEGIPLLRYVHHSTERVAQITGQVDPTGKPMLNNTDKVGVMGTDLGIPVEHGGRLYLFFGDNWNPDEDEDESGDAIAWTTDRKPEPSGIRLDFVKTAEGEYRRLVVDG